MYMTQFTSAEEEFAFLCPMFLQQYILSPPCVIETPYNSFPFPSSVNTEAREYIPGMFICFMEGGRQKKHGASIQSSELNAFFKVELNFVQNPPQGGRHYWNLVPLENGCGFTVGLALISIHLACPFVWGRLGLQLEGWWTSSAGANLCGDSAGDPMRGGSQREGGGNEGVKPAGTSLYEKHMHGSALVVRMEFFPFSVQ